MGYKYPKGHMPWNKEKKGLQICWNKGKVGIYTKEQREQIGKSLRSYYAKYGVPTKGKKKPQMSGKNHPNWRGGKEKNAYGYYLIRAYGHPFIQKRGTIFEHRFILENHLRETNPNHPALVSVNDKLYLNHKWIVHHKNGIKTDNRPENLEPLPFDNRTARYPLTCPKCGHQF